jgi:hypothetical protein
MKTLWNIYTKVLIGVLLAVLIGAGGVNYYTKTQSDAKYYAKTQADTTFVKVADGWQLRDSIYFKEEIDSLNNQLSRGRFERSIQSLTGLNIITPVAAWSTLTGTIALSDGFCYYHLYEVTDTIQVSAFQYMVGTSGVYTPDNYNGIALFSYNKNTKTYTKIIETANDGAMWSQTASGLYTKTFTPQTLSPGFYAVAMIYNSSAQTTAPSLYQYGTINSLAANIYGHYLGGYKNNQTAIPSSETYSNMTAGASFSGAIILK